MAKNDAGMDEPKNAGMEEREEIFIPRGSANDDPNLFVSVNGENYLLPKGKKSNVPKYIAAEIKRAWAAQEAADLRSDQMLEDAK